MDGNLTWQQGIDEIDAFFDVEGYIADAHSVQPEDAVVTADGRAEGVVANGEVVRLAEETASGTDEPRGGSSAALTTREDVETHSTVGEEAKSAGDAVLDAPDSRLEPQDPDTLTTDQGPVKSRGHSVDEPKDSREGPDHMPSQAKDDDAAGTTHLDQPHYTKAADALPAPESSDAPPLTRRRMNSMNISFIVNTESGQPETEQEKVNQIPSNTNVNESSASPRSAVEVVQGSRHASPAAAPPTLDQAESAISTLQPTSAEPSAAPEAEAPGSGTGQAKLVKTNEDDAVATKAFGTDDTKTSTSDEAVKADQAKAAAPTPAKPTSSPKSGHTLPDLKDSAAAEQLPLQTPLQHTEEAMTTPQRAQDEMQQPSSGDKSSLIDEMRREDEDAEVGPNLSVRDSSVAVKLQERLSEAAAEGGEGEMSAGVASGETKEHVAVKADDEATMADDTIAVKRAGGLTGEGDAGGELDAATDAEGHAATGSQKNPERPKTQDASATEQDTHTLAREPSSEDELASISPRTIPRKRKAAPKAATRPARKKARKAAPVVEDAVATQKAKVPASRYSVGARELKDLGWSETTLPAEAQKSKAPTARHYIPARELKELGVVETETLPPRGARRGRKG